MSDGLRACPHCGGGEFRIDEGGKVWTGQKYSEPTTYTVRHWCKRVEGQPAITLNFGGKTKQDAIDAWNRRTYDPAVQRLVEALEFYAREPHWGNTAITALAEWREPHG